MNTGNAIKYATENFFSAQAGARGSEVPKVLTVVTDSNASDDVEGPAGLARKLGISVSERRIRGPQRPLAGSSAVVLKNLSIDIFYDVSVTQRF